MSSTLIESVRNVLTSRRATAERTYRRLVTDPDSAKSKDAEALADALRELNKRPEDYAGDVASIAQARQIASAIPSDEDVQRIRDEAEAWTVEQAKALAASRNRRRELITEFTRETKREKELLAELEQNEPRRKAEALEQRAAQLRGELAQVRNAHPMAFAD
jgi:hypothetical protein